MRREPPGSYLARRVHDKFTNLQSLVEVLKHEIAPLSRGEQHSKEHVAHITQLLATMRLNPREWQQHTNFVRKRYTRTLVGCDTKFVALLLCWDKGQSSPIHDHAEASCWVKMLSGSLHEVRYERQRNGLLHATGSSVMEAAQSDVTYMHDSLGVHQILNPSTEEVAVSLHIYSPPFQQCHIFQPVTGEPKIVSMVSSMTPLQPASLYFDMEHTVEGNPQGVPRAEVATPSGQISLQDLVASLRELGKTSPTSAVGWGPVSTWGDAFASKEKSKAIRRTLAQLELSDEEWRQFASPVHFSEFRYTRNLVYLDEDFSVVVLCWNAGQATPIHTHGTGVVSWMKVLHGELKLDAFKSGSEQGEDPDPIFSWSLDTESGVLEEDEDLKCHRVGNRSDTVPAVSIHVYSPPLKELRYREAGAERQLPVVNHGSQLGGHLAPFCGSLFSNFEAFSHMLDAQFKAFGGLTSALEAKITHMLRVTDFHPSEWEQHATWHNGTFARVLLAQTDHYSMVLTCFDRGQCSQIHDHGGSSQWIKVLQGSVYEVQYEVGEVPLRVSRAAELPADSLTFLGPRTVHRMSNDNQETAFTLNIYAKPFTKIRVFDTEVALEQPVEFPTVSWPV